MRDASLLRRLADAASNFVDDHVIVRRVATQQATDTNDCVVPFSFGKRTCGERNLEGTRNANQRDVLLLRARTQQSVVSALKKPLGDKGVESGDDDGEPPSSSAKPALDRRNLWLGKPFEF